MTYSLGYSRSDCSSVNSLGLLFDLPLRFPVEGIREPANEITFVNLCSTFEP
ncbi:unnamed protein product [Haemonchus placei]|uniref:Uncharacterized protein n=1 Tax=Haemonchus placei TaxID=6290 RepID=A0A3P7WK15_HAEPC|nr:unnamed protein product [Haemonchus placei]